MFFQQSAVYMENEGFSRVILSDSPLLSPLSLTTESFLRNIELLTKGLKNTL